METKAQLYNRFETLFPGKVEMDIWVPGSVSPRPADIVVKSTAHSQFVYWIFGHGVRNRSGYRNLNEGQLVHTHFVYTRTELSSDENRGKLWLNTTKRELMSHSVFDLAVNDRGCGHLHFLDSVTSQLRIFRGVKRVGRRSSTMFKWKLIRGCALEDMWVCSKSGELLTIEDTIALREFTDLQKRREERLEAKRKKEAQQVQNQLRGQYPE